MVVLLTNKANMAANWGASKKSWITTIVVIPLWLTGL